MRRCRRCRPRRTLPSPRGWARSRWARARWRFTTPRASSARGAQGALCGFRVFRCSVLGRLKFLGIHARAWQSTKHAVQCLALLTPRRPSQDHPTFRAACFSACRVYRSAVRWLKCTDVGCWGCVCIHLRYYRGNSHARRVRSAWGTATDCELLLFIVDAHRQVVAAGCYHIVACLNHSHISFRCTDCWIATLCSFGG